MVVLLVALTFAICWLIDRLTGPKPETPKSIWVQSDQTYQNSLGAEQDVEGYRLCEGIACHQGHMWVKTENLLRARIGLDDFICQHTHPITSITPLSTHKLKQGAPCLRIYTPTYHLDVLAPIGGEIIATNRAYIQSPSQIAQNPFGAWLYLIENENMSAEQNNLIRGEWVFVWMQQEASQLRLRQKMGKQIDADFLHTFFNAQVPSCSGH